jgi:hypothetical protein
MLCILNLISLPLHQTPTLVLICFIAIWILDPDMLEVGNGGMAIEEYRAHFSIWALAKVH